MAIKSKKIKREPREKKKLRLRKRVLGTDDRPRLSVFRSSKHTYAQLISDVANKTLVSASTLEEEVQKEIAELAKKPAKAKEGEAPAGEVKKSQKSVFAARAVGIVLARRGKEHNVSAIVFDRNGFIYTGRVRAVADGAREGGLQF
jgi:large subunit ribosomal protein L18